MTIQSVNIVKGVSVSGPGLGSLRVTSIEISGKTATLEKNNDISNSSEVTPFEKGEITPGKVTVNVEGQPSDCAGTSGTLTVSGSGISLSANVIVESTTFSGTARQRPTGSIVYQLTGSDD